MSQPFFLRFPSNFSLSIEFLFDLSLSLPLSLSPALSLYLDARIPIEIKIKLRENFDEIQAATSEIKSTKSYSLLWLLF